MPSSYDLGNTPSGDEKSNVKVENGKKSVLDAEFTDPKSKKDENSSDTPAVEDYHPVSFLKLYQYASGKDKLLMLLAILSTVITGLCTPANILIFGQLIDSMVSMASQLLAQNSNSTAPLGFFDMVSTLWDPLRQLDDNPFLDAFLNEITWFLIYYCIIGVIMFVFTYTSVLFFNNAAHNQIYKIRSEFLRSTLNQDIEWYDLNKSGEFASRMNEDLSKLEDGLGEKVVIFAHFFISFIGSIIAAFIKGWLMTLVCLVSLPVTLISMSIVAVLTGRLAKREMEEYAVAGSIAEEVFSSIRTVMAFGGARRERERYVENLTTARQINIQKAFFSGLGFGMLWFFIYASYSLAFWFGVGLVIREEETGYSAGGMFTVFFLVMMGSMSLSMSAPFVESFGIAKGAAAKVFSIIARTPKIDTLAAVGDRPEKCEGHIEFKKVYFNYPSRKTVNVLQGVSLHISRGETVALVGSSGCGKSTCIQLIQRFYDLLDGEIAIDGRDIKTLDVTWLRSKIGVVGQEPVLFDTTIYENISYGNELASKEDIENAAKAANAHNFIKKLPNGYETLVGEKGAQMSGGQKQRIAIARALVRNPDILLLDEATSALDTASEAKVQAALEKASEGRTTIIVAHRLSTIRKADKIFVLKDGMVVEIGNHKELMAMDGQYKSLVLNQVGSFERDGNLDRTVSVTQQIDEDDLEIDMMPEELIDERLTAASIPLMKLMRWNQDEWIYILIGCICSVAMGAAMPFFSIIFGGLIGTLSLPDPDQIRSETNMYSVYFLIIGIVSGLSSFLQIYTYGRAGEYLTQRLRIWSFEAMLRQEVAWFDDKRNGTGTLCAQLSNDASAVQGATGQRVGLILQSISTLVLSIGIAMWYEWRLGFVALCFTPVLLLSIYFQVILMRQENMGSAKALEKSTKLGVEVVANIRTVVSLGKEKMFHQKYINYLTPAMVRAKNNTHIRGVTYGLARSIMFFAYGACMMYGGQLVAREGMDIATIFTVTQALMMGTMTIANSLAYGPNFQKGLMAAGKINQLLERSPEVFDPPGVNNKSAKWNVNGNINYKSLVFSYPTRPNTLVLQGLNIEVQPGQTIALVGQSGCGKSTCIQLLERFYDSAEGNLTIDNTDIKAVTLNDLRGELGLVSQEPVLFDKTIRENIAFGDNSREIGNDEIIEAAKQANIHNFVVSLPLGYDTRLGDKGTQLSGGQKQRIAIARALIRNPKILLLDEATSALDSESEKVVQAALDAAREGRTCITIAHRLTTIVDSDVIFVIEQGQVAEQGTHKELLAKRGRYYKLYTIQSSTQ